MIAHTVTKSHLSDLYASYGTDTYKMALYSSSASLDKDTAAYTATGEVSGAGYTAGGVSLVASASMLTFDDDVLVIDWDDPSWTSATFTARGALIYNSSDSNKSATVIDFVDDQTVANDTFTFQFPLPTKETAIIRGLMLR